MNKVALIILLITSISCGAQKSKAPKNVTFYDDFINEVPELKTPLELNCGFEKLILNEEQVEKLSPFTPAGFSIIGKLSINPKYNILIVGELTETIYYPYVFVTDNNGMNKSNKKLFESTCTPDSAVEFKYRISVNSEDNIVVTERRIDKISNNVKSEATRIYKINKKGEVMKQ